MKWLKGFRTSPEEVCALYADDWEWGPESAAVFLGLDVKDKPFWTQDHTFHVYNDEGKIIKESSWWDASAVLRGIGMTAEKSVFPTRSAVGAA